MIQEYIDDDTLNCIVLYEGSAQPDYIKYISLTNILFLSTKDFNMH